MESKDHLAIAKMLYAMEMKKKKPNIADQLQNERYQRTMSDEYPWSKPPRGRREPVSEEQKEQWKKLHGRG